MKDDAPFKVGDKVRCSMCGWTRHVVRTVTRVERTSAVQSKFRVYADGGQECRSCDNRPTEPIDGLDSGWFELVDPACPDCL